ncbi:hypothetical protein C5167_008366 [Papaver somniferum]|uniref:Uncharacterized protein n=1 Tax=Papaver somniferum TaxID=3469 RepID=A0A4Y7JUB5_PAPSO|nr:hypothetical protein C5167_008366 [Papaver somniferum]
MGGGGSFSAGGPGKGCTHGCSKVSNVEICIGKKLLRTWDILAESPRSKAPHKESAEKTALGE